MVGWLDIYTVVIRYICSVVIIHICSMVIRYICSVVIRYICWPTEEQKEEAANVDYDTLLT